MIVQVKEARIPDSSDKPDFGSEPTLEGGPMGVAWLVGCRAAIWRRIHVGVPGCGTVAGVLRHCLRHSLNRELMGAIPDNLFEWQSRRSWPSKVASLPVARPGPTESTTRRSSWDF